jgi:N utilization substance protein B
MGVRRRSREMAMQALYFMDVRKTYTDEKIARFCDTFQPSKRIKPLFLRLINGVIANMKDIDDTIERFSKNWQISRMSYVDRNIIRIGVFEMIYCPDIPPKVSINEAVDVGKKFGTEESGSFINGIMDSIHLAIEKEELDVIKERL